MSKSEAYLTGKPLCFIREEMVLIKVCGEESQVPEAVTVQELIMSRNLSGKGIIIAVNENVVRRELWTSTKLNPDDNVEIIRIVSGG
jgi:thiamine biosynthesis protein ThiS